MKLKSLRKEILQQYQQNGKKEADTDDGLNTFRQSFAASER